MVRVAGFRRSGNIQSQPRQFFLRGFNLAEHGADGVVFARLGGKFYDAPAARRSDGHAGLVRFDLDQILVGLDEVAGLDQEVDDFGLGDGFAELRHDDGNLHKLNHKGTKAQRFHKMIRLMPSLIFGTLKLMSKPSRLFVSFKYVNSCASKSGSIVSTAFNSTTS